VEATLFADYSAKNAAFDWILCNCWGFGRLLSEVEFYAAIFCMFERGDLNCPVVEIRKSIDFLCAMRTWLRWNTYLHQLRLTDFNICFFFFLQLAPRSGYLVFGQKIVISFWRVDVADFSETTIPLTDYTPHFRSESFGYFLLLRILLINTCFHEGRCIFLLVGLQTLGSLWLF
jgi:hypothetical protein